MKKILSIIIIIVLSTILGLAYNASTNLSLRLLEATDDIRPFREDFNYNFELVDDIFDDVSLIEFSYLDGVTSSIQDQIDSVGSGAVDTSGTPVDNDIAVFTDLNTIEGLNYAELKAVLDLEIGTDIQAYDAGLLSIAGLTTAANKSIYTTALDTYATYDLTAFARTILDDADEATVKATLNLEIGTDVLAQQTIGIADNNLLEVDGLSNADEYARFTANGLVGRTEAEFKADFNLEIGTDVLAYQAIGIADDNLLEVDDADAADNDYAKFTAAGLEGRSYAEVMMDTNPITTITAVHTMTVAEAGTVLVSCAATPYTITLPTASGHTGLRYHFIKTDANYFLITLDGDGAETFNYESSTSAPVLTYARLNTYCAEVTIVSDGTNWQVISEALGQTPKCRVGLDANQLNFINNVYHMIDLNVESYDIGSNYDVSEWVSGDANVNTADHLIDTVNDQFTAEMVGKRVKNTDDTTYAYVLTYNDVDDLTLSADIFPLGTEAYQIMKSEFVCPVDGVYFVGGSIEWAEGTVIADKKFYCRPGTAANYLTQVNHSATTLSLTCTISNYLKLSKDDIIYMKGKQSTATDTPDVRGLVGSTYMIIRLVSKD